MSKGLKALEKIVGCSTIESHRPKWQEDYKTVEKSLKALEIIKKKRVNVRLIYHTDNFIEYSEKTRQYYDCVPLTQEEYDLLKEVLL